MPFLALSRCFDFHSVVRWGSGILESGNAFATPTQFLAVTANREWEMPTARPACSNPTVNRRLGNFENSHDVPNGQYFWYVLHDLRPTCGDATENRACGNGKIRCMVRSPRENDTNDCRKIPTMRKTNFGYLRKINGLP
jgi:hypothetical protein